MPGGTINLAAAASTCCVRRSLSGRHDWHSRGEAAAESVDDLRMDKDREATIPGLGTWINPDQWPQ